MQHLIGIDRKMLGANSFALCNLGHGLTKFFGSFFACQAVKQSTFHLKRV